MPDGCNYWSPYLQHFLHETKALTPYTQELMTEIYINDINEVDNGDIYNEMTYRNSLFRNIQMQNPELNFESNFLCVPECNLKMMRNLPFFMSPLNYKLITPVRTDEAIPYTNAFLLFFSNGTLFRDVDHYHKVHKLDELHLARIEPYLKDGDIIYECERHELEPTKIAMAVEKVDENDGSTYLSIEDISLENLIKSNVNFNGIEIFKIIKEFLNGSFKLTDETAKFLNDFYYKPSIENYILIPILIYILK